MDHPTFLHYTYYHCTKSKNTPCTQGSIAAQELERQIDTYLSRIAISARCRDWVLKHLQDVHKQEVAGRNDILASQQRAYQDCLQRLENVVHLKTSPQNSDGSLLSDEEYGRQRMHLLKEKARLEELFRDTGHRVDQWLALAEKTFVFACSARTWFAEGDLETKKSILSAIGSNLILKDKKLSIEAKKPFVILEKSLPCMHAEKAPIEPEIFRIGKGKRVPVSALSPTGRGRWDDVRTYGSKKDISAYSKLVQEVIAHMVTCEQECPQLLNQLNALTVLVPTSSEYLTQVA
jgi:hypothetical protein